MNAKSKLLSDFWWLSKDVDSGDLLVGVGHHRTLTDEDNQCSIIWFHSFEKNTRRLSQAKENYQLDLLSKWQSISKNTNIYRTIKIFDRNTKEAVLIGPFLIDIDNSVPDNGFKENLIDAKDVAYQVILYLTNELRLSENDLRIFFSGRKGFNIEVRPQALGVNGGIEDQIRLSRDKLYCIVSFLRSASGVTNSTRNVVSKQGTVIDSIYGSKHDPCELKHPYIRLHNSINKWIRDDASEVARMRIEVTIEQLWRKSAEEICLESKELAAS